jgi:hypothetical protein
LFGRDALALRATILFALGFSADRDVAIWGPEPLVFGP